MTATASAAGPKLLSLDLWHTLIFLEPEAEETYMHAQAELATDVLLAAPVVDGAPPLDAAGLRKAFDEVYAEAVAASQEGRSVGPSLQIERAGSRTGRVPDPKTYLDGLYRLVERTPFQPAPGAREVLSGLHQDGGWATAVVSNTVGEPGEALRAVLRRTGIEPLVDAFVFSDEGPWTKPAPEIFGEAMARVGATADRTVHVGDGWVDIEGARRAHLRAGVLYTELQRYGQLYRTLFLPAGWSDPETPYRIRSWPELPGVLSRIL